MQYNLPMSRTTPFRTGIRSAALLCSVLLLCTSCASFSGSKRHQGSARTAAIPAVYITDTKAVSLLPPSAMAGSLDGIQLFTGSYGTQRFSFQAYTRADGEGISMTLLNEMGITLATFSYSKDGTNFQSAYLPDSIRAEYMLMDFQNCYYDADALRDHYAAAGLRFACSREAGREYRRIFDGGHAGSRQDGTDGPLHLIEEIIREKTAEGERLTIQNSLRSYRYELLQVEDAEGESR